jgi:hypothetical protein
MDLYVTAPLLRGRQHLRRGRATLEETTMMRLLLAFAATCLVAGTAAGDTCKAQSEAKKLHGAAETSFMTKCEKDAKAKCEAEAKAKNLHCGRDEVHNQVREGRDRRLEPVGDAKHSAGAQSSG